MEFSPQASPFCREEGKLGFKFIFYMIKDKMFGVVHAELLPDGNHGKLDDEGRPTMEFRSYVKRPGFTSHLELVEEREHIPIEHFYEKDLSDEILEKMFI